ncbi:MAG TPA: DciA family protein [Steroidobacteraceae bacterium]|nr:DciA family protein [Steroidobacteraceae bacterium]
MRTPARLKTATAPAAHSVKELLLGRVGALRQVTERVRKQEILRAWLASQLPANLREKITGISEHEGVLTVFAESAVWCARLRYALAELENLLQREHPEIRRVSARVLPRS